MNYTIYATYDNSTVRVYQAFNDTIANEIVTLGRFGTSFNRDRETWIKPSFYWMMYRSGWGKKDNQNRILAIDLDRNAFDTILKPGVLTQFDKMVYPSITEWNRMLKKSDVKFQFDPDRNADLHKNGNRAIQIGLRNKMVDYYIDTAIVKISDITNDIHTYNPVMTAYPVNRGVLHAIR